METWSPHKTRTGEKPQGEGWVLSGYKPREKLGWTGPRGTPLYVEVPIYTRQTQPAAAPPPPAPAPAPAPAPKAPTPSAESTRYRDEAASYMRQAQEMLNQFKIEQQRAAEAARLAEEMRIKSQASMAANLARQQQTPNLQIQPATGTPQTAGTQAFKRRRGDMLTTTPGSLSALNIASPSTLNV